MLDPLTGAVLLIIAAVALVLGRRNLDAVDIEEDDSDNPSQR